MAKKNKINANRTGLTFGTLSAILHGLWVLGVGIGISQRWTDWIKGIHFLDIPISVTSFSLGAGIIGIGGSFVAGYIIGWLAAVIWNWSARFGE